MSFVRWYNTVRRHSGIEFVTPVERHTGADNEILTRRKAVYERAKAQHPTCWNGKTRDWSRPTVVKLNPDKPVHSGLSKLEVAAE